MINASWFQKGADGYVSHLLIDSRKLLFPENSIFFALKSSRDGHRFIGNLYSQGVRHFVISENVDSSLYPDANLLLVNDTLKALQLLSATHRSKFSLPVIGITGSNGKTIVKEWLNQLLEHDYLVVRSPGSYNSQIGVPLSVWMIEPKHQLGIFEAGISRKDEMGPLEKIIRPEIGIFTNLGMAHSEGFDSLQQKLEEKWILFKDASIIIYRKDQSLVDELIAASVLKEKKAHSSQQYFSWGFSENAGMNVKILERQESRTVCSISSGEQLFQLNIPFTDEASIENALTCCATMLCLQRPVEDIVDRIGQLHSVPMRLELKEGINHCSVINDSYSADLSSLVIALDFLSQQLQHNRKTVILSDIPETGLAADKIYDTVAGLLQHHNVIRIIAIGPIISQYSEKFTSAGMEFRSFFSTEQFQQHFDELIFHEETILVKGARRFAFENISALLEMQVHQTVMEIDLNAMLYNLKQFQHVLKAGTRLMAMVKAFSYGSGSYEIANLLQFQGVDYLAVAYTDEAVILRKAGIHLPIMVMNAAPSGFGSLVEYNLEPVLYSIQLFKKFESFIKQEGIPQYPVHLEMETGMNRLGFAAGDLPELLDRLPEAVFKIRSVFSHLAASEDPAHDAYTAEQVSRFMIFCKKISEVLPYTFLRHIENTAAINRHPEWQFDMVRLGIGLYGIDTSNSKKIKLKNVSTLKSTIAQIKYLEPGETVGYGRKGKILIPSVIATVRIGYADGYPRSLGNGTGKMLVNGQLAPVIGIIAMDMTMIDITGIRGVKEGDGVVIFGSELPVEKVADWAGTIPYEILTGISQRVKRIYYQD
jgi:alanine racemase